LSLEPHALPQAAGAPASELSTRWALWPKPNSFERFIVGCKIKLVILRYCKDNT
jgi:hypothetical protein